MKCLAVCLQDRANVCACRVWKRESERRGWGREMERQRGKEHMKLTIMIIVPAWRKGKSWHARVLQPPCVQTPTPLVNAAVWTIHGLFYCTRPTIDSLVIPRKWKDREDSRRKVRVVDIFCDAYDAILVRGFYWSYWLRTFWCFACK